MSEIGQINVPVCSVVIPSWNAAETIERAIISALGEGVEVLVVDDASTDTTRDVVQASFGDDARVRLILQSCNGGVSAARNRGIADARGCFVAFLDADDLWLPGKLACQLKRMHGSEDVRIVTCDSLRVTADGVVVSRSHQRVPPAVGVDAWKALLERNFLPTPTVLARTADVRACGGFRENLPIAEDLDLWIRLARAGSVEVVPDVLVHYVDYPQSLIRSHDGEHDQAILAMLDAHVQASSLPARCKSRIMIKRYVEFGRYRLGNNDEDQARTLFACAERLGHSRFDWKLSWFKRRLKERC